MDDLATCWKVYRRMGKAFDVNKGMRLSADEVAALVLMDAAIGGAVENARPTAIGAAE